MTQEELQQAAEKEFPCRHKQDEFLMRPVRKAYISGITSETAMRYWEEAGWISVEDRLPNERILACDVANMNAPEYNQHVFKATWFLESESFNTNERYMGSITHWRKQVKLPLTQPNNQLK